MQTVKFTLALAIAFLIVEKSAKAAMIYSDRTAWQTAAGGGTGDIYEDFNNVSSRVFLDSTPYDSGAFVIDSTSDSIRLEPTNTLAVAVDGSPYIYAPISNFGSGRELNFTFDSPISALGFDVNGYGPHLGRTNRYTTDIGDNGSYDLPTIDVTEFRGFVFTSPVTTFTIGGVIAIQGMDNIEAFSAASVSAVPEPTSLTLFGLGAVAIGLASVRQRRKKKGAAT